jgi:putative peptidoglycan lipid II flippase
MSKALLKASSIVSGMTFISRILGFIRDMVFAQLFGAGTATDAFFVAFKIPNLMRRLFAEGGFALAFVPVFSQYKTERSPQQLQHLLDTVAGTLSIILFAVTVVGVVAAPLVILLFAPGFTADQSKYELTVSLLRITFPYLLFISLTGFAGGVLNSCGRFAVPAITPVILNICLITSAIWVAPHLQQPVMALAWGVFIAGVAQLLLQIPALVAIKQLPKPRWGWRSEGVQRVCKLMIPTLFGSSVAQINLLFDTLLASLLVEGTVSWLYYSDRLVEFPLGLFGVTLGVVILPSLSQKHAATAPEEFSQTLDWALRWALLIGLPATVALILLAGPLLATLFQYGEFTAHDVRMASYSLMAYAVGLLAFMVIKVLNPGFYARQDTRTPVKIGVIAMAVNMVLNVIFIFPLAHAGLALATSLSSCLNAGLLLYLLCRRAIYRPSRGGLLFLIRLLLATSLMGGWLWIGLGELTDWVTASGQERILRLAWLIGGGFSAYLIAVFLVGIRPRHLTV